MCKNPKYLEDLKTQNHKTRSTNEEQTVRNQTGANSGVKNIRGESSSTPSNSTDSPSNTRRYFYFRHVHPHRRTDEFLVQRGTRAKERPNVDPSMFLARFRRRWQSNSWQCGMGTREMWNDRRCEAQQPRKKAIETATKLRSGLANGWREWNLGRGENPWVSLATPCSLFCLFSKPLVREAAKRRRQWTLTVCNNDIFLRDMEGHVQAGVPVTCWLAEWHFYFRNNSMICEKFFEIILRILWKWISGES